MAIPIPVRIPIAKAIFRITIGMDFPPGMGAAY
jgi:hypothetical protein